MLNGFRERWGLRVHHHRIDLLADANALVSGFVLYPQLFKLLTTHDASGLAPTTFLLITVTNIIWVFYGIHRKSLPVIISSALSAFAALAVLVLILIFARS